jgi:copper chaperone CopZ
MTIKRELAALSGVSNVSGDPTTKKVSVTYQTDADLAKIKETMNEIGYPIEKEV